MNADWCLEFFDDPLVVDFWERCLPAEKYRADADFLERTLGLRSRLLDVPCGGGRHAVELARRGCRVTGVDVSREFLNLARERASRAGLEVELVELDMRSLRYDGEFDGAYCMGNSFGYFPPAQLQVFCAVLARALRPGGVLAIETGMAAESLLPALKERESFEVDGLTFAIENRYLADESCLETEATFVRGGTTTTKTWWHWVYTVAELGRMLERAGLHVRERLASVDGQPYRLGQPTLLLVAEKRE